MSVIDPSYFTGKINLPQTGNTEGTELVQQFIDDYENEYLQKVLGYDLFKAYTDDPDNVRFDGLNDGAEFAQNGKSLKWTGLKTKPSPIAQYVYGKFLESEAESVVLVGTATAKTENAERTNPDAKIVSAWNDMVRLNHFLAGYLNANSNDFPEWERSCWYDWSYRSMYWGYWNCPDEKNEVYMFKNRYGI